MKKLIILVLIVGILVGCGNPSQPETSGDSENLQEGFIVILGGYRTEDGNFTYIEWHDVSRSPYTYDSGNTRIVLRNGYEFFFMGDLIEKPYKTKEKREAIIEAYSLD